MTLRKLSQQEYTTSPRYLSLAAWSQVNDVLVLARPSVNSAKFYHQVVADEGSSAVLKLAGGPASQP